ncbi:hypothetical protein JOM56_008184 [Amanita muscaria]
MATGHACTKVFARLKAVIPHHSALCFEPVRRLEHALEKASLASKETVHWHCRLCQVVSEIDQIAELVVNLEEEIHSLQNRLLQWFALALGTPYTPYSKSMRVLERECRTLILFLESTYSTDPRCPDIALNHQTSTMFESAREFQITGASVANLSGNSNTVYYFPVIFTPQEGSSTRQGAMETIRNNEYGGLHAGLDCPRCHQLGIKSGCDSPSAGCEKCPC